MLVCNAEIMEVWRFYSVTTNSACDVCCISESTLLVLKTKLLNKCERYTENTMHMY